MSDDDRLISRLRAAYDNYNEDESSYILTEDEGHSDQDIPTATSQEASEQSQLQPSYKGDKDCGLQPHWLSHENGDEDDDEDLEPPIEWTRGLSLVSFTGIAELDRKSVV